MSIQESQLDQLLRERDEALAKCERNDEFMAYMTEELGGFECLHGEGHRGTPPMMWPELIKCIAAKAVQDAKNELESLANTQLAAKDAEINRLNSIIPHAQLAFQESEIERLKQELAKVRAETVNEVAALKTKMEVQHVALERVVNHATNERTRLASALFAITAAEAGSEYRSAIQSAEVLLDDYRGGEIATPAWLREALEIGKEFDRPEWIGEALEVKP